jgi:triosephosphate isomerase
MLKNFPLKPPFFEIGPKNYLYGDDVLKLALKADEAAKKYDVDIIFTAPYTEIRRVAEATDRIFVFLPHTDPLEPGRGLADVLPEALKAAGAAGVMLNHCEKPMSPSTLRHTINRADGVGLATIVCADSIAEAKAVAELRPNIVVPEPTELIGTGKTSDMDYVMKSIEAVKSVDPIYSCCRGRHQLRQARIRRYFAGSDASGSSSGVVCAPDMLAMVDEMIHAAREAWDARH